MLVLRIAAIALAAMIVSLATPDARAGARGPKRAEVREIIVHATGGPFCKNGQVVFSPAGDLATMVRFFTASRQVSIHYIVDRSGDIARSVPEDEVAIHTVGHNDISIGIELINAGDGREAFTEAQIAATTRLIAGIRQRWRLPVAAVKGHEDVDHSTFPCGGALARRKQDPGPLFPWQRVRAALALADGR